MGKNVPRDALFEHCKRKWKFKLLLEVESISIFSTTFSVTTLLDSDWVLLPGPVELKPYLLQWGLALSDLPQFCKILMSACFFF